MEQGGYIKIIPNLEIGTMRTYAICPWAFIFLGLGIKNTLCNQSGYINPVILEMMGRQMQKKNNTMKQKIGEHYSFLTDSSGCIYIHLYIYTHTQIYTHAHMHTYMHQQSKKRSRGYQLESEGHRRGLKRG